MNLETTQVLVVNHHLPISRKTQPSSNKMQQEKRASNYFLNSTRIIQVCKFVWDLSLEKRLKALWDQHSTEIVGAFHSITITTVKSIAIDDGMWTLIAPFLAIICMVHQPILNLLFIIYYIYIII